jgi:quercetin dioxygenase-like cupin family protein
MIHHTGYAIAGRLQVKTDEGEEREIAAGQAFDIQPGHDAWVVGDEAFETVDFSQDADRYATRPSLES